jgi:hypothetical protein
VKEEEIKNVSVTKMADAETIEKPDYEKSRYEFALSIVTEGRESLICRRGVFINNYIPNSLYTLEFKDCVDRIVSMIQDDLNYKSRIYMYYRFPVSTFIPSDAEVERLTGNRTEKEYLTYKCTTTVDEEGNETEETKTYVNRVYPEWETELTSPIDVEENNVMFKFTVYDCGKEVISKGWDATIYPAYIRKNVDLTNRLVRVYRDNNIFTYDKDTFFTENDNLYGDLKMLKVMIMEREDLIPKIQRLIADTCSSNSGYYDNIQDYKTYDEYKNEFLKDGKKVKKVVKTYNINSTFAMNNKLSRQWEKAVSKKTWAYAEDHYFTPLFPSKKERRA